MVCLCKNPSQTARVFASLNFITFWELDKLISSKNLSGSFILIEMRPSLKILSSPSALHKSIFFFKSNHMLNVKNVLVPFFICIWTLAFQAVFMGDALLVVALTGSGLGGLNRVRLPTSSNSTLFCLTLLIWVK